MKFIQDREFIAETELRDDPYRFDLLGLWRGEDGFYLGTDSGCSCPTPWESHTADDLTGPLTLDQVVEESTSLWNVAGRKTDLDPFLLSALKSFQSELDLTWTVDCAGTLDEMEGTLTIKDADGVEWDRTRPYDVFVRIDTDTYEDVEIDAWDLKYPVTIIANERN